MLVLKSMAHEAPVRQEAYGEHRLTWVDRFGVYLSKRRIVRSLPRRHDVNVPTWRGKFFLEFSAFRLGLSPALEMDDHKMYYNKPDLWPMLVRSGFKPSGLRLRYHKFGLNLFAVAQRSGT